MCFDICTINIRVSIRVRGLHLVFGVPRIVSQGFRLVFFPTRYGWLLTTVRYAKYLGGLLEGVLQQPSLCKDLRSVSAMSITIVLYECELQNTLKLYEC